MAALGSGLLSRLHRFFWPDGPVNDPAALWLDATPRAVLWWSLVLFAALDVLHPVLALTGSWWFALFVLWMTPWRQPVCAGVPQERALSWLSSLFLFSWLIYRTQHAVGESVSTWYVFKSTPWWLLSFPMHRAVSTVVTATLTVIPLRRVVGERATTFAVIASFPYAAHLVSLLKPSPSVTHQLVTAINLCDAAVSLLIIAAASSLLARYPIRADRSLVYRRLRMLVVSLLTGKLNAAVALFGVYGGTLAAAVLAERSWGAHYWAPNQSPAALAGYSAVVPVTAFTVVLAAIVAWRSLARARRRHVVIANLTTLGRLVVASSAGVVVLVEFFLVMPRVGHSLSEGLQLLPGPAWSISSAQVPGTLRLSGEFQPGVSDALATALAQDHTIQRLELDSPGGDTHEGLALASLVKKYELSTFVRHKCSSACTLVFIAGRERSLAVDAKLGFHRARSFVWDDIIYEDGAENHQLLNFVRSKGIDENFARKAYAVPNADIWYPSMDELLAAGVITSKPLQRDAAF
jgi:hypothetical protein